MGATENRSHIDMDETQTTRSTHATAEQWITVNLCSFVAKSLLDSSQNDQVTESLDQPVVMILKQLMPLWLDSGANY